MSATITEALEHFEATEANIAKLERLCAEIYDLIPSGIEFTSNPDYDDKVRSAQDILGHLPMIDGWKPSFSFLALNEIAQMRFDFFELGEPMADIGFEASLDDPARAIREYRYVFNKKRRQLIKGALDTAIDEIDQALRANATLPDKLARSDEIPKTLLETLRKHFKEIHVLLGSSATRPAGWSNMSRHLSFGMVSDLSDIVRSDWPAVKVGLRTNLYGQDDPIPVKVSDLGELVASAPKGPIPTKLNWRALSDESFERLIYALIVAESGYENPEWLTATRAADRGRDLSVVRVIKDGLSGQMRSRVVIQCKHWMTKSVGADEVAKLKEQMNLWEPPRIDVLIIATSGRFSADAVAAVERQATSDRALKIEMWPESHLEMLLAGRPALIGEFGLR